MTKKLWKISATKKRSSSLKKQRYLWGVILASIISMAGILTVFEYTSLYNADVSFFNIRYPIPETFRRSHMKAEKWLNNSSSLMYFTPQKVYLSSVENFVSPRKTKDVLSFPVDNWQHHISHLSNLSQVGITNYTTVAIAFEEDKSLSEVIQIFQEATHSLGKALQKAPPTPIFYRLAVKPKITGK